MLLNSALIWCVMTTNMFSRQISLLGKENQERIESSTVTIVGIGALGSAVAHLLVRMGVKRFILIDDDSVAIHNLSRQHLYTQVDIGVRKVEALKKHLIEINPNCEVKLVSKRVSSVSDLDCAKKSSIVVDGLDNHASRRIIDLFCKEHALPWIHGAAIEEKGSVIFFDNNLKYSDVYDTQAVDTHCNINGVLATTTTLVATFQAQLVINFLLGRPISKELIRINNSIVSVEKFLIR